MKLVRQTGLEPATVGLEGRCSIRLSYRRSHNLQKNVAGRGRGIRTPDFCVPNATLYQTELYPAFESPIAFATEAFNGTGDTSPSQSVSKHTSIQTDCLHRHQHNQCPENKTECKHPASPCKNGAPGEIRTPDHLVRSQVLYPTELRAHCEIFNRTTLTPWRRSVEARSGIIQIPPACVNLFLEIYSPSLRISVKYNRIEP